jgi:hypothetical protein
MVVVIEGEFGLLLFAFSSYLYLLDLLLNTLLSFIAKSKVLFVFVVFSMEISIHL